MVASSPLSRPVTAAVVEAAKAALCAVECVGILENLPPLVGCVSRQLAKSGSAKVLKLPETNSIAKHSSMGAVTTKQGISAAATELVRKNSWADVGLHEFARRLVETRPLD